MADQAESSRRAPPMTPPPPPPPSPAIPEDNSSEAILWAASEDCSCSTSQTDWLSLWLSTYTALPEPEAEEEPLAGVPILLNFDLESSSSDLVDWNTTGTAVKQAPVVTQPLWVQLDAPAAGEVDDMSPQALGIHSPNASILPLELGIQFHEASPSPLAQEVQPPPASISPLALGLQFPQSSFRIQFSQASISPPISPLGLGIQSPQTSFRIQSAPASFWSLPQDPCTLPTAPPLWNLPSIPCTLPMAPPLWNLSTNPCTLPVAPPLWNFLPSPSPVPERRSWSMFPSTPPPARRQLLLPHSAAASVSSSSSHLSHQTQQFFPAANTGYQQQGPKAHAPVTFSTPIANANSLAGFVPPSRPTWSQAMAPRGSRTPNQPGISNGQDMEKLPISRRPRFVLPPAAAPMPAPPPLLAHFGSSEGNMPNWIARGDVPVGDHQRVPTGESSRPSRKRSRRTLDPSIGKALQWSHNVTEVVSIVGETFAPGPALNRNGQMRALPGTATDSQSLFARYKREKMNQRVRILQTLVPNGDKADLVILLEQAHIYIKFLEQQIKLLKSSVNWKLAAPFVYNDVDLLHPQ